jgi:hypothetical protein
VIFSNAQVEHMDTLKRIIASAVVVVPMSIAFAETPTSSDASAAAVEKLKSSVKGGVEVENVRMSDDGVACIQYRGPNYAGSMTNAYAVVQGDKVYKSSIGNKRFEEAWNEHCAGNRDSSKSEE